MSERPLAMFLDLLEEQAREGVKKARREVERRIKSAPLDSEERRRTLNFSRGLVIAGNAIGELLRPEPEQVGKKTRRVR
ncbi:MAG: hypothetical protein ACRENK_16430 [Gemmatimonadaceae bacterium]